MTRFPDVPYCRCPTGRHFRFTVWHTKVEEKKKKRWKAAGHHANNNNNYRVDEKKWQQQHKVVIKAGWEASTHAQLTFQRRSVHLVGSASWKQQLLLPDGLNRQRQTKEDRLARAWPNPIFHAPSNLLIGTELLDCPAIQPTRRNPERHLGRKRVFGFGFWRNVDC